MSPALSFGFRGSFAASSRALSFFFFFLSFSPPSPLLYSQPPQFYSATSTPKQGSCRGGKFKTRPGFLYRSSFFFSCLHRLLQGRVLQRGKARIRRFFFLTPSILRFIRTCTIALSLLSPPPKKRKTKAVSSLLQLSWLEGGLLCCWEKKKSSQNL